MYYPTFDKNAEFFLDSFFERMSFIFSKNSSFFAIDKEDYKIYTFLGQFDFFKFYSEVFLIVTIDGDNDDEGSKLFFVELSKNASKGWYFTDEFSNASSRKIIEYFSLDIPKPLVSYQKEEILKSPLKQRLSFYELFISLYKKSSSLENELFTLFLDNDASKIESFNEMNRFFEEFHNNAHKNNGTNNKMKI